MDNRIRQGETLGFRTPQHPSLGTNNWGGASPLLARDIPKESLEQRYLRINSIRSRDEIFPVSDHFFPHIHTPTNEVPQTPSRGPRGRKGFLLNFVFPEKDQSVALGSDSKKKRWFTFRRWDHKKRWPQGWC